MLDCRERVSLCVAEPESPWAGDVTTGENIDDDDGGKYRPEITAGINQL